MKKQKLTIIDNTPYGYLVDSCKWSEYLKDEYDITFLTHSPCRAERMDNGDEGIKISYAKYFKNHFIDNRLFILKCWFHLLFHKGPVIVECFRHCDYLKKLAPRRKMILDIRTLAVGASEAKREKEDRKLLKICNSYNRLTVISEGVREKLALKDKRISILPLGSDVISDQKKDYTAALDLVYVGILAGRDIEKTLYGLHLFHEKNPDVPVSYNIIGGAAAEYLEQLKKLTAELQLSDIVKFAGYVNHKDLGPHFSKANVGVSFVPMTDYYDAQPVTKTFEYSNSGLYVIGTATTENKKCIDADNGVLIQDTPESFAEGLEKIWKTRCSIDEKKVRTRLEEFTWKNIVHKYLKPVIEEQE